MLISLFSSVEKPYPSGTGRKFHLEPAGQLVAGRKAGMEKFSLGQLLAGPGVLDVAAGEAATTILLPDEY